MGKCTIVDEVITLQCRVLIEQFNTTSKEDRGEVIELINSLKQTIKNRIPHLLEINEDKTIKLELLDILYSASDIEERKIVKKQINKLKYS